MIRVFGFSVLLRSSGLIGNNFVNSGTFFIVSEFFLICGRRFLIVHMAFFHQKEKK